jgi:hypothetical protein
MKRPLLHVGYHKTGTTWLQFRFFISEYGYGSILDHDDVSALVVDAHESERDAERLAAAAAAGGAALEPGQVPVVSSEILCGNPFHGGAGGAANARLLAQAFPDARILITIREQRRILTSVYMQYLSRGGTLPPEGFFAEQNAPGYPRFRAEHFRYAWLIGLYRDLFGAGNVLVLTQEEMARDLAGFLAKLSAFAEAPRQDGFPASAPRAAPSHPEAAAPLLRRINHFRAGPASSEPVFDLGRVSAEIYRWTGGAARRQPLAGLLGGRRPVTEYVTARFAGRFADSNQALGRMVPGLDLTGYEM